MKTLEITKMLKNLFPFAFPKLKAEKIKKLSPLLSLKMFR